MTQRKKLLLFCVLSLFLFGCAKDIPNEIHEEEAGLQNEMFTDTDFDVTYENFETITLDDNQSMAERDSVSIDGNAIVIKEEGTYLFSGKLEEGQIIVDAKDSNVQIVLANASITNSKGEALFVKNAESVKVTMKQYSYNHLNTTANKSAIYAKSDITFNGDGNLEIESMMDGIISQNDLKITSGSYEVTSNGMGMKAGNNIKIAEGKLSVHSKDDSINSEKGYIYVLKGMFSLQSEQNGFEAADSIQIEDGYFEITSKTGMQAQSEIHIKDGMINFECEETLCSQNTITIDDGDITISSQKNGISSPNVTINGGNVSIEQCSNGIKSDSITIQGGTNSIYAKENGMYANTQINIVKGRTMIVSDNSGMSSKGTLKMNGGIVYISAPKDENGKIIDIKDSATIVGGSLIGAGMNNIQADLSKSSIGCVLTRMTYQEAKTPFAILDSNENVIESFAPENGYNTILICSTGIQENGKYSIRAGSESKEIVMNGKVYKE